MAGNITLDNLVSVSELSHGGVSKTLSRVGNNNPIVVMRNNKPAAGVISPDEYRRLTEAEEDFALYLEAEERMKKGDGTRLGMAGVRDQGPGGRMGHVDACGPSACPARFRTTSCEWTNGPHAGPIMRPTRKPM